MPLSDPRFAALADPAFAQERPSRSHSHDEHDDSQGESQDEDEDATGSGSGSEADEEDDQSGIGEGMDPGGFAGPSEKTVKPLTPEALAAFKAAQEKTGGDLYLPDTSWYASDQGAASHECIWGSGEGISATRRCVGAASAMRHIRILISRHL